MPRVTRTRTIDAAPEAVWRVVSDPHHLPRWWPAVQRVEEVSDDGWTKVLATPTGKTLRADFTRVDVEEPRRLVWRQELVESPFERVLSAAVTELTLDPAPGDATRVQIRATRRVRGLARFGGFMVRRATRTQLDDALDGLDAVTARDPSERAAERPA
jgi:uncharacterized protein YndB with AHSA1/START domain